MLGRKPKYKHPRNFTGYLDETDLKYLDDRKGGKMGRLAYLIECMYALKTNPERVREKEELISQLQKENYELKRQLMFERSKNNKPHYVIDVIDISDIESKRIEYYNKQNLTQTIDRIGIDEHGWSSISSKNLVLFKDSKTAKNWILNYYSKIKSQDKIKIEMLP